MNDEEFHEEILAATRELTEELPQLVGDRAEPLKVRLDHLITEVEGGLSPATVILTEIAHHPETRRWLAEHLSPVRGGGFLGVPESAIPFQVLPGQGAAIDADEYVCPEAGCNERWFRRKAGQRPPLCSLHGKRLIPKA